jgi:hypothetical protein
LKFVCHRWARRRRLASRILFGVLIAAFLAALLLGWLGVI